MFEIKPIDKIQTKFNVFRKQNTHKSSKRDESLEKENKFRDTLRIQETNLNKGFSTVSKLLPSAANASYNEPLDLNFDKLEMFYD